MSQLSLSSQPSQLSFISQPDDWDYATQNNIESNESSDSNASTPRSKGWIGEHFEKKEIDGVSYQICRVTDCQKMFAVGISTNTYKRHYAGNHSLNSRPKKTRFMFHDSLHSNRFVKMVIASHLSYRLADTPEFKSFVESLNSNKTVISRKTLSETIARSRSKLTERICDKFEGVENVSLTFDIWSAHKGARGFGCVTAHFISNHGMENIILQFKRMTFPHDAEVIRKFISKSITVFKLEGKITAITTDNASNNIAAIRTMDNSLGLTSLNFGLIHYKCVAHILHLGLEVGLKELKELVKPVREAVMSVRSSRKRKEMFLDKQRELIEQGSIPNNRELELSEDIDHRWNSSYSLLERALLLREVIDHMFVAEPGMRSLERIDWTVVRKVVEFLKPFYDATKRLCCENDITISAVGYIIPRLMEHCEHYELEEEPWVEKAAKLISAKLTAYQLELYHPIVDLAYFLDPRYKTLNSSEDHLKGVLERVQKLMEATSTSGQVDSRRSSLNSIVGYDSEDDEQSDELKYYRSLKRELMKTDVIAWWRLNSIRFPRLSVLAFKILQVQATSVASERVFSIAKDVDKPIRNRLADESVEAVVLFKSWMKFLNLE